MISLLGSGGVQTRDIFSSWFHFTGRMTEYKCIQLRGWWANGASILKRRSWRYHSVGLNVGLDGS